MNTEKEKNTKRLLKNLKVTEEYNDIFKNTFNELGLDGLNEKIQECNAIISGSFIIHTIRKAKKLDLNNDQYKNMDIDIYIKSNIKNYVANPHIFKYNSIFDNWIIEKLGGVFYNSNSYSGVISYKYFCPKIVLNIIIYNPLICKTQLKNMSYSEELRCYINEI